MKFIAISALLPLLALAAPTKRENYQSDDHSDDHDNGLIKAFPFEFTSTYTAYATPDQVINANQTSVPGQAGSYGTYKFGINVREEYICYNIAVYISGNYSSPAKTATHVHQAPYGRNGPPRLAFPNPTITAPIDEFGRRVSAGCISAPFTTGLLVNGTDTAANFSLTAIEANPAGFFADVHGTAFPSGLIRGQLELAGTIY